MMPRPARSTLFPYTTLFRSDQTARAMQQALQASGIVKSSAVENIAGAAGTIGLARLISAERGAGNVAMISGLIMLGAVRSEERRVGKECRARRSPNQ